MKIFANFCNMECTNAMKYVSLPFKQNVKFNFFETIKIFANLSMRELCFRVKCLPQIKNIYHGPMSMSYRRKQQKLFAGNPVKVKLKKI